MNPPYSRARMVPTRSQRGRSRNRISYRQAKSAQRERPLLSCLIFLAICVQTISASLRHLDWGEGMGIFGGRDAEWEAIKDEYRSVKEDIAECETQIQLHIDAAGNVQATRYQYLVQEDIEQDQLSRLGLEGWDLVNFASYSVGWGVNGSSSMKVHLRYVFKRPAGDLTTDGQAWINRLAELTSRKAELASAIELRGYKAD